MPEAAVRGRSIASVLAGAASSLARAGSDTPRLDAELLLGDVLGVERERLVLDAAAEVDDAVFARFRGLVARREAHEPVAYIIGRKHFRGICLSVDRRVLIPRPETELLVEVGLSLSSGSRVVDVGTGSGAVALALKSERPDLDVWATDVDSQALVVARENGARLGVEVEFVHADLLDGVPGAFDAVLANLPYVAVGFELPPDVVLYEPVSALFAGGDGLDIIRRLVSRVADVPLVALEVGFDQAPAVCALLGASPPDPRSRSIAAADKERTGFRSIEVLPDLAGHNRVVVARR